jgi:hypothetical protein
MITEGSSLLEDGAIAVCDLYHDLASSISIEDLSASCVDKPPILSTFKSF